MGEMKPEIEEEEKAEAPKAKAQEAQKPEETQPQSARIGVVRCSACGRTSFTLVAGEGGVYIFCRTCGRIMQNEPEAQPE